MLSLKLILRLAVRMHAVTIVMPLGLALPLHYWAWAAPHVPVLLYICEFEAIQASCQLL